MDGVKEVLERLLEWVEKHKYEAVYHTEVLWVISTGRLKSEIKALAALSDITLKEKVPAKTGEEAGDL